MIRFAIRNAFLRLRRNRTRSLLVGLAVAIGAAAITVHGSLVAGVRSQMLDRMVIARFGHVSISPAADRSPDMDVLLPLISDRFALTETIRKVKPGSRIVPSLSMLGMAFGDTASTSRVVLQGVEPGPGSGVSPGSILLGAALAEQLNTAPGDLLALGVLDSGGDLDVADFEVGGILARSAPWEDHFVTMTLNDLQDLLGRGDVVNLMKVFGTGGPAEAGRFAADLQAALRDNPEAVQVETYDRKGRLYMGIIQAATIQAGIIDFFLLLAIAFGVAGAQILAVHERHREIGTMSALGTSRTAIRIIILMEGAALALVAGAAGALAGCAVSILLGRSGVGMSAEAFAWMVGGPTVSPLIDPAMILSRMVGLLLIVTLAGLYPASRAARLLPTAAMRGEAA